VTSTPRLTFVLLVATLIAPACGTGEVSGDDRLSVVATTTILGDVVREIGEGEVAVEVLTPLGADPHDFTASSAQIAAVNRADLVIANGLGLEEGLHDVLDAAESDGVPLLELAPSVNPLPFDRTLGHDEESGGEEDRGSLDPHIWLDPLRMAEAATLIAARLSEIEPDVDWLARADRYGADLAGADEEIAAMLSSIPASERRLVTNHESMGYFADRYDFEVIGVVVPGGSTLGDPSSEELAALVEVMEREAVRAIFAETTQPSALAEAVAAELGEDIQVVGLYTGSLGEPNSGADTLIGMLLTNAQRIAEALGG
jgi:zinc/manganese transport system substrate-binding protein